MIPGVGVHLWKQRRTYCRHNHDYEDDVTPSYYYYRSSSSQLSIAAAVETHHYMDQTALEARQRLDEKLRHIRPSRLNLRKENEMIGRPGRRKVLVGDSNDDDDWKQLLGGVLRDIMSLM
ncbi:uncharacterized protein LOC124940643 [Impatiens glandulifera]|uniref:uncharacterized protein LOC124940643 n=1 Tax=Impatiens glandulifera TaxID=253017 RepID=UPI001FB0B7AC|nr:uncharacterized protein LOC124940643 [Impatiens glandulifera]XP_047337125.1 uncharacterized protein LOC124940643 [Impatiens glandulifera]